MKDGHAGVAIGSEVTGGCRNVWVENCTMDSPELDRIIRIKSNAMRGDVYKRQVPHLWKGRTFYTNTLSGYNQFF